MNVIKKYWDSVYLYVLLLIPGFCMCAGIYWSILKSVGMYEHLSWAQILLFDFSQLVYLGIAIFFIYRNKKDSNYIPEHLLWVKGFTVLILFIQYNVILYLFPSPHVWECTFLFFAIIVFLFDSKLLAINVVLYFLSLVVAYSLLPEAFLPRSDENVVEIMAYRIMIYWLTAICIMLIVYFVEHFLMQAKESDEENVRLLEKQLHYYRDVEFLDKELRKFRHDIKNHFLCMEMLMKNERTQELQDYFLDLQQSFSFQENLYFTGNDIVDAILNHDLPHYCKNEVGYKVQGSLPQLSTVSAMDLCTIFSNLLSNAIAAAGACEHGEVSIVFGSGKKYFSIAISNSILEHGNVKMDRKSRNHGFGMGKIKSVLDKYEGKMELDIRQSMVTITIYLPI